MSLFEKRLPEQDLKNFTFPYSACISNNSNLIDFKFMLMMQEIILPAAAAETFPLNAIAAMLVRMMVTDPNISIRNMNHRLP